MPPPKQITLSDALSYISCHRRVWFDHNPTEGLEEKEDQFVELLKQKGIIHEATHH